MAETYLFYDVETTGRNEVFDQIVQFAAVRTDRQLREQERVEWRIRLRPDVLPAPGALLTHRLSIDELQQGEEEYVVLRRIHRLVNEPGTISIGYNSLGFDDLFLRWGFYRNLLEPYTHQWKNSCGRMDLLPITILYWLHRPDILRWPEVNGTPSLKLEHLNEWNELATGQAHDALVDVLATVALARRLRRDTQMWSYCRGYFNNHEDAKRRQNLRAEHIGGETYPLGVIVDIKYGYEKRCQQPVVGLGAPAGRSKNTLWLHLDDPNLTSLTWATAGEAWVTNKKDGEPPLLLPLDRATYDPERGALVARNLAWLRRHPTQLAHIARHHREKRYEEEVDVDIDAALYRRGFLNDRDRALCRRFHEAAGRGDGQDLFSLLDQASDSGVRDLGLRLLVRNPSLGLAPTAALRAGFDPMRPATDYRGRPRRLPAQVREEIARERRKPNLTPEDQHLLDSYEAFLDKGPAG